MSKIVQIVVSPKQASDSSVYLPIAYRTAGVKSENVALARVVKRSIDARNSPKINLCIEIFVDDEPLADPVHFDYPDVSNKPEVVVVGSGPAGLFAALRLIEQGFKPIVLERGKEVSQRKVDVADINRNKPINPDSNYAFGEGGAGTFSDGKLYTRSKKRGDYNRALRVLVFNGADESILYDAHPHIGSDKLPRVIKSIRERIIAQGGRILFNSKVTDFIIKGGKIGGVSTASDKIEAAAVILATGHSASDMYELLDRAKVSLEAKPFAMGVRVEHPQGLIDSIQYHQSQRGEYLPAASYSLVSQVRGRGVYSFCMCPGGFIVPAMTTSSESVVNGMSPSGRNSLYANSGIVTEVRLADFGYLRHKHGELAGLVFQRQMEQTAKLNAGENQIVPASSLADFVAGKRSRSLPKTSYVPGTAISDMNWMPAFIKNSLRGGFEQFDKKMRGFVTNEAIILGVESRTSSPVRIPRDAGTMMHPDVLGLFPCGEGAGYAGGIISAALDGERVAEHVAKFLTD